MSAVPVRHRWTPALFVCGVIAGSKGTQSLCRHYLDWQVKKLKKLLDVYIFMGSNSVQLNVFGNTFLKTGQYESRKAICPCKPEINHCKQIFIVISHLPIIKHGGLICGWSIKYYLYIGYVFKSLVKCKVRNLIIFENTMLQSLPFM